jgi:RNA polymerase sigma factor (sigma-70 family)
VQSISDENIMLKVCEGQIDKLGLLFERYHVKLYNFYMRNTMDQDLSRDLTQNVFERILKYRHTYKEGATFKSWFYQIARNVQVDYFKKQKINTANFDDVNHERNLRFSSDSEPDLEKEERLKMLHQALNQLPPDKREILVMSQLEELEYKEIAEIFKITENLARVKVHRALKSLKEIFQKFVR